MIRSLAITRIQDGLGFASRQSDKIILRLQEAQRDLEKGKTLPRFLVQEAEPLTLLIGTSTVALPDGFLRIDDTMKPYYVSADSTVPNFVSVKRDFQAALEAYKDSASTSGPKVAFIRKSVVDFVINADQQYTVYWNYFKAALPLTSDIENEWLANAPEWLIGEAGYRMALDARDQEAVAVFQSMLTRGRAACFGEILAAEDASGPLIMGANL